MRCPFCAEEIQDAAILCRYCGATKQEGVWKPPATTSPIARKATGIPGQFTLRSAGALFLLSAVFELFSLTAEVPLFGGLRGGLLAVVYHTLFVAVFSLIGIGLWRAEPWGYRAVIAGTCIYLLDRALFLMDDTARFAALTSATGNYKQLLELIDLQSIDQMVTSATLITLACWIGFAAYVHRRRDYFDREP